jgi:hypothetical protein
MVVRRPLGHNLETASFVARLGHDADIAAGARVVALIGVVRNRARYPFAGKSTNASRGFDAIASILRPRGSSSPPPALEIKSLGHR